jgi:sterol desaturase/sphingolipid hydroxylase (fatty acid hydroxylase superfamily)
MDYGEIFLKSYRGYANYFWKEITNPGWHNYFYWLLLVSVFFLMLEWISPWRKEQPKFRKDFWLDTFYMFFNFFLFSLIIYNAASDVVVRFFNEIIEGISGFNLRASNPMRHWPAWGVLLTGFVVRDFIQWWVHRLLHRSDWLWEYHKLHHSVEQMGFAAHLRYHWMETIVYRTIEYIPLALLGIGLHDFFVIHIFTLAVGHYNHANISVPGYVTGGVLGLLVGVVMSAGLYDVNLFTDPGVFTQALIIGISVVGGAVLLGPVMKKLFNHPEMHIWHHAHDIPEERRYGVNFGITLAVWDYIFGTVYMPYQGKDIKLGFDGVEEYPSTFLRQFGQGIFWGRKP